MSEFIIMLEDLFRQNGIKYCIQYDPQQMEYYLSYDGTTMKITEMY